MTKGRRHKSKNEQYYGEPYKLKTLVEVKVCTNCGREMPERSKLQDCPYCGGTLIIKCIPKQKA
jgi:predicted RNA-binding Zn-ribbon protein involved in translation (DUF1610 family)